MRRFRALVLAAVLALTLSGCGRQDRPQSGKLNVVCTLFPYYDFVRQIGGDAVDVQLLVPAGRETHSFEPTPLDVIAVSEAEVFIYNGGESELWVEDILDAAGEAIPYRLAMMDCVETYREEYAEGMQGGHDHDHDDHDHDHGESCTCGCHDHDHDHEHHHHHHADEVFTSWGMETAKTYTAEEIQTALEQLEDAEKYGMILRAKGIVAGADGKWIHFDYVPGTPDVRTGSASTTGRLCVIGSHIQEDALAALFRTC